MLFGVVCAGYAPSRNTNSSALRTKVAIQIFGQDIKNELVVETYQYPAVAQSLSFPFLSSCMSLQLSF